jgi:hypothetical protein
MRHIFIVLAMLAFFFGANPAVAFEKPFQAGEKLLYKASWLWFEAGMVETAVPEIFIDEGKHFARFTIHTWTTHSIAHIFNMDDSFESLWNIDEQLPKKFVETVRESHTTRDKRMEFDNKARIVTVWENKDPEKQFPFKPLSQDFITASYVTRGYNLEPKTKVFIPVFEDNKNYDAQIDVIKKERITVMDGEMDTVLISGTLGFEGAFQNNKRVYLWLSDDEYHVPVRVEMAFIFGSVRLTLEKAEAVGFKLIKPEKK